MELMFRSVVSWYKILWFILSFGLSWFWVGRKFLVKMAKSGHFCFSTTPERLGVELHLGGGPYA